MANKVVYITPGDVFPNANQTAAIMAGLGTLGATMAPTNTGRIFIAVQGHTETDFAGNNAILQLAWGTGTPPATGAPQTGTILDGNKYITPPSTGAHTPFSFGAILTGLPRTGVKVWVDLVLTTDNPSNNVTIKSTTVELLEV